MFGKSSTPSFVYEMKLQTNPKQAAFLSDCFWHGNRVYNDLIAHCKEQLDLLGLDVSYHSLRQRYIELKGSAEPAEVSERKACANDMNRIRDSYGLTPSALEFYVQQLQKQHQKYVNSHVAQKLASSCWKAVDQFLFGNGKKIHFRKLEDMLTLEGKNNNTGIYFDGHTVTFMKQQIAVSMPKRKSKERKYHNACMKCRIKYCRLKRRMFPSGWQYYIQLILEGTPPRKHDIAEGNVGIDLGTSTVAAASEHGCILENLGAGVKDIQDQLKKIQVAMDASLRRANPENYEPDGRIKKGRKTWNRPKTYLKLRRRLKTLYRRRKESLKCSHEILANQILFLGNNLYVERMNISSLAKRSKLTVRRDAPSVLVKKDGIPRVVYKFKRKKRFGHSIGLHAPAALITILNRKLQAFGKQVTEIDPYTYKASQYNHAADTYQKKKLSDRSVLIDNNLVQRDLYSAFLLQHPNPDFKTADRDSCLIDFRHFLIMHDACIAYMSSDSHYNNPCFGLHDF